MLLSLYVRRLPQSFSGLFLVFWWVKTPGFHRFVIFALQELASLRVRCISKEKRQSSSLQSRNNEAPPSIQNDSSSRQVGMDSIGFPSMCLRVFLKLSTWICIQSKDWWICSLKTEMHWPIVFFPIHWPIGNWNIAWQFKCRSWLGLFVFSGGTLVFSYI